MEVLILIVWAVVLFFFMHIVSFFETEKIPLCCCGAELKEKSEASRIEFYFSYKNCAFTVCQCPVCGGVIGFPRQDFECFLVTANRNERQDVLDVLYSNTNKAEQSRLKSLCP